MVWTIKHNMAQNVVSEVGEDTVQCVVTSPPYWNLRDYGVKGEIGHEFSLQEYIQGLVNIFRGVKQVLEEDGTLWLNIGDCYVKKDLVGVPWKLAFALQADGWILRSDIIWAKPNPMPESIKDRPTRAHEYLFLFTKSRKYYYDNEAIKEPVAVKNAGPRKFGGNKYPGSGQVAATYSGNDYKQQKKRNKRDVWTIAPKGYKGTHFATFPEALVEPCILAGSKPGDLILDPFCGSGTTGAVAIKHGRNFIGIDLNPEYVKLARERLRKWNKQE